MSVPRKTDSAVPVAEQRRRRQRIAYSAADAIAERRGRADDPDLARLGEGLLGLVTHVGSRRSVPDAVIRADVPDALRIIAHLRDVFDVATLEVVEAGRAAGMTWDQIAEAMGSENRQAAYNWYNRLVNAVRGSGTKDDSQRYAELRWEKAMKRWCDKNGRTVVALVHRLQVHAWSLDEDVRESLDDLAARVPQPGDPITTVFVAAFANLLREAEGADGTPHELVVEAIATGKALLHTRPQQKDFTRQTPAASPGRSRRR